MTLADLTDHQLSLRQSAAQDAADKLIRKAETESRGLTRAEDDAVRVALRDLASIRAERERRTAEHATTYAPPETQRTTPRPEAERQARVLDARGGAEVRNLIPSLSEYAEARALGHAGPSGGYLVPGEQADRFFDWLRPQTVVLQAGPRVITMSRDSFSLPKIGSSVTANFYAENSEFTATDMTLQQHNFYAKKLGCLTRCSNELLRDASPSAREVVTYDMLRAMGARIDLAFLEGAASIVGLRNTPEATVTALGSGDGAAPTFDDILAAIARLESDNARASALFCHPRTWSSLKKIKDGEGRYMAGGDVSGEAPRSLFNVPVFTSSQISVAETTGINADCSWIGIVDMSQVVVARRQDVEIQFDESRYFEHDQTGIRAVSRWDFGVLSPTALEIISGVRS